MKKRSIFVCYRTVRDEGGCKEGMLHIYLKKPNSRGFIDADRKVAFFFERQSICGSKIQITQKGRLCFTVEEKKKCTDNTLSEFNGFLWKLIKFGKESGETFKKNPTHEEMMTVESLFPVKV